MAHKRPVARLKADKDCLGALDGTLPEPSETGRRLPRTTTHGSRTATGGAKRSRASTAARLLTGHGVALLGNNRRPCCATPAGGLTGPRVSDRL
ncbi:MAG: hypothetical protein LBD24_09515 [Spirochaetaceae bacterium]|nr:hypothetical protein [Spirochaetaceae bacterium]